MKFFDKRYIYYGNLEYQQKAIGGCRCEVVSNEIDPESWNAMISVFDGSHADLHHALDVPGDLLFKATDDQEVVVVKPMFPSFSIGSYNDEVLRFKIKQFISSRKYNVQEIRKVYLSYFIPSVELYKRRASVSKHYRKGLLSGWNGWRREYGDQNVLNEWDDEIYSVPSDLGTIAFAPIMLFQEAPIEEKEATVVVDQMIVECALEGEQLTIENCMEQLSSTIDDYLYILSFLEGDLVQWYLCRCIGQTVDKKPAVEFQHFKPIRTRKKRKDGDYHSFLERQGLQRAHVELTRVFRSKSEEQKRRIRKVIDRFIVASRIETIDTRLIYWHSCLDVLAKEIGGEGRSFSHRIVNSCMKVNIDWRDIYPGIDEASLEQKAEFPINRIRNAMLHQGEYPDDYTEAFDEIRRTRALCERLITKILGFDYKGTGLGVVER